VNVWRAGIGCRTTTMMPDGYLLMQGANGHALLRAPTGETLYNGHAHGFEYLCGMAAGHAAARRAVSLTIEGTHIRGRLMRFAGRRRHVWPRRRQTSARGGPRRRRTSATPRSCVPWRASSAPRRPPARRSTGWRRGSSR
jgi:hypothetical protein